MRTSPSMPTLKPGAVSEVVTVSEEPPPLQTQDSSVGQTMSAQEINNVPLNGRNWVYIAQLAPGVALPEGSRGAGKGDFNANGQRAEENNFILDGVDNNANAVDLYNGASYVVNPPPDALAEFKVQTAAFDASAGHSVGSVVNVSTKSGTNQVHGQAEWALRNSMFDAPNIFQNRAGQKPPHYTDNRWGLVAGGPVWLPRIYNGKNRTFWLYGYGANKFGVPQSFTSTVPTVAMRRGDLSALLALGAQYQVYDPSTTVAVAGHFQRQPFANNVIPTNRLDSGGAEDPRVLPATESSREQRRQQ